MDPAGEFTRSWLSCDVVLHAIQRFGGTVFQTKVDSKDHAN